jgi:hypothetical protein
MPEEHESDKKDEGSAGITAGGDVITSNIKGDTTGQVATGKYNVQTQFQGQTDLEELRKSLLEFQQGIAKLRLSSEDQNIVNGDISAAIKESKQEKPVLSKIKARFESAVNTAKEAGKTIKDISELYGPAKKIATMLGIGLAML